MSVLTIRDENNNIIDIPAIKGDKGEKGDTYMLTEADKEEIADIVLANFTDVSEAGL